MKPTRVLIRASESSSQETKGVFFRERYPDMIIEDYFGSFSQRMQMNWYSNCGHQAVLPFISARYRPATKPDMEATRLIHFLSSHWLIRYIRGRTGPSVPLTGLSNRTFENSRNLKGK